MDRRIKWIISYFGTWTVVRPWNGGVLQNHHTTIFSCTVCSVRDFVRFMFDCRDWCDSQQTYVQVESFCSLSSAEELFIKSIVGCTQAECMKCQNSTLINGTTIDFLICKSITDDDLMTFIFVSLFIFLFFLLFFSPCLGPSAEDGIK